MNTMDFTEGDFSFSVCPVIITDQDEEMKERVVVTISVMGDDRLVDASTDLQDAVKRIEAALFGGPLEFAWVQAALVLDHPHLDCHASFRKDRQGVHPDILRATRFVPEECDAVQTLFYRFVDGELVDDSDGANERDMPAEAGASA